MGLLLPAEEHPREDVGGGWPVGSQAAVGPASPFLPSPRGPSMGTLSAQDLRGSARSPSVLPTKRHGRSLSEPDERAISRSPRLPGGPRVWTPVTKRRCHSSGSAWLPGRALPATSAASAPAPWLPLASGSLPAPGLGRPPAGARTPSHDAACRWRRSAWCWRARPHPRPAARPQPCPHPRPSRAAARACSTAPLSRASAQAGRAGGSMGVQRPSTS
ncbi:unnamed protein product [Rangifer tarandus platyrhynchus]|uniref:Uncharacterized protein n=1 Tax=Rangifer tarandus platyrhynchus TaxID=3082113 RepID=A0ABN8ZF31_RANTA|nr:unnamed protein product [Rangifer tarandus platyrhynchus]